MVKYDPALCPCHWKYTTEPEEEIYSFLLKKRHPRRISTETFRVIQICKVFSAGEIGEGPARGLNSRPSAAVSMLESGTG